MHPLAVAILVTSLLVGGVVIGGSVIPLNNQYDVSVTVNAVDIAVGLGNYYSASIASTATLGQAHLIDWTALGLSFVPFTAHAQYSMKVCVANQCSTKQESTWFPSIPILNGNSLTASDTFKLGYVPGGSQPITVELDQNGVSAATASGTMCVGGTC